MGRAGARRESFTSLPRSCWRRLARRNEVVCVRRGFARGWNAPPPGAWAGRPAGTCGLARHSTSAARVGLSDEGGLEAVTGTRDRSRAGPGGDRQRARVLAAWSADLRLAVGLGACRWDDEESLSLWWGRLGYGGAAREQQLGGARLTLRRRVGPRARPRRQAVASRPTLALVSPLARPAYPGLPQAALAIVRSSPLAPTPTSPAPRSSANHLSRPQS